MLKKVATNDAPAAIGPYSQAVICGDLLYTSGQIPIIPSTGEMAEGDIAIQAKQVMENLGAVLKAAGASFSDVIKTTCFLADMNDFAQFNTVYEAYFTQKPARSCVEVSKLPKGALCEVEVVASLKQ